MVYIPDQKVYKGADAFSRGESDDEVREIILPCLGEEVIERILNMLHAKKAYLEDDGGCSSFLEAVNDELGEYVYIVEDEDEDEDEDDSW